MNDRLKKMRIAKLKEDIRKYKSEERYLKQIRASTGGKDAEEERIKELSIKISALKDELSNLGVQWKLKVVVVIVILFSLGPPYLFAIFSERNEDYLKDDSANVQVFLKYPYYISKGKPFNIKCWAYRKNTQSYEGRLEIISKSKYFRIKRGVKDIDLTKEAQTDWTSQITYNPDDTWFTSVRYLFQRKYIDIKLTNKKNRNQTQTCLSFRVSAVIPWIVSLTSSIGGFLLSILVVIKNEMVSAIVNILKNWLLHKQ